MAKHDFGIMNTVPGMERYDAYTPEPFDCIAVEDVLLDTVLPALSELPCFWHARACPGRGRAECGITLIPPESLPQFVTVLQQADASIFLPLIALLQQASARQNYVIHFGL